MSIEELQREIVSGAFSMQVADCERNIRIQFEKLQQENKQLKYNWNKLKEFIVKEYYMYLPLEASTKSITILTNKMQELEQGSDSNE